MQKLEEANCRLKADLASSACGQEKLAARLAEGEGEAERLRWRLQKLALDNRKLVTFLQELQLAECHKAKGQAALNNLVQQLDMRKIYD